jgi:hypothetical protein
MEALSAEHLNTENISLAWIMAIVFERAYFYLCREMHNRKKNTTKDNQFYIFMANKISF